jgi:hypothetical protein
MTIVRGVVRDGHIELETPLPEGTTVEIHLAATPTYTFHDGTPHGTRECPQPPHRPRATVEFPMDGYLEVDLGGEGG